MMELLPDIFVLLVAEPGPGTAHRSPATVSALGPLGVVVVKQPLPQSVQYLQSLWGDENPIRPDGSDHIDHGGMGQTQPDDAIGLGFGDGGGGKNRKNHD